MPVLKSKTTEVEVPDVIKPYITLGLDINYKPGKQELLCDCPLCGREGKFSVNAETGQWRCFVCGGDVDKTGGGIYTFLQKFYEVCEKATPIDAYSSLARDRALEFSDTIVHWGLVRSTLNDKWLVPGWGPDHHGKLTLRQLYTYTKVKDRMLLMPLKNLGHALLGLQFYDESKPEVYVAEGIWDGMRLWEVFKTTKQQEDGFVTTASSTHCLLAECNVVAAPSNSFNDAWTKWVKGKNVKFLFDNDYPKPHPKTGQMMPPAGTGGMKRATILLNQTAAAVSYLHWGDKGYDPELPDGFDVRDALKDRSAGLKLIFNKLTAAPDEWIKATNEPSEGELQCKPCSQWSVLINAWRKAMKWTPGLEHAFCWMLVAPTSTKCLGDQLWFKIIGPAACGKSTLCEALTVNRKYVKAISTIRGFHSGYKSSPGSKEDNSLIPLIRDKTFITKDGDTLLQAPNLGQILAEARDVYDRVSRTHYRNQMSKDYEGINTTWLLCGTSSLRSIDSSELGERFLDVVVMEKIDIELENDILKRVAQKALTNVDLETDGDLRSHHSPELCEAMELTGGYVNWLRENANRVLKTIEFPEQAVLECTELAKWVAYLRARPSAHQKENAERELATRLTSVLVKSAKCLAMVLNRPSVDERVMAEVRWTAMDTARGMTQEITKLLFANMEGMTTQAINIHINLSEPELKQLLRFLWGIGVLRHIKQPANPNTTREIRVWKLTNAMLELCRRLKVDNRV